MFNESSTRFVIYVALGVLLAIALTAGLVTEANLDVALKWLSAASLAGFVLAAKNVKN